MRRPGSGYSPPRMSRAVRYHVIDKIAHGGMAEIFLALQVGAEGFQKHVVLKRILPALAADPSFVRMLVDEAHIASTLNHSNLVQVLDLGKVGDEFFLVLEFVDGWSLEQVRRRARKARMKFPLPLALYAVSALCRALAYAHTRKHNGQPLGIVHRDVTPQNVLISREGEVKLADFGIAKAIGRREKSATGVIKGKFAYMSPEQSVGGELDARSDLFSVGTVLYLLTTGSKPFEGTTDLDVLMRVRKGRYEKPSVVVKDFNPEVERFIARALRTDRARRWQSAEQMADRLDAILMKLGQTSGPAVFKRWLETLAAKDGTKPPSERAPAVRDSDTIQLASSDLELEALPLPPLRVDPDTADEPPTRGAPLPPPLDPSTVSTARSVAAPTTETSVLAEETTATSPARVSRAYDAIEISAATPARLAEERTGPPLPLEREPEANTPALERAELTASAPEEASAETPPFATPAVPPASFADPEPEAGMVARSPPTARSPIAARQPRTVQRTVLVAFLLLTGATYVLGAQSPRWLWVRLPSRWTLAVETWLRPPPAADRAPSDDDGTNWTGDPRPPESPGR